MKHPPRHTPLTEEQLREWAIVELYRWQHSELPPLEGEKPVDVDIALLKMAKGLLDPKDGNHPGRFQVGAVLTFVAEILRNLVLERVEE